MKRITAGILTGIIVAALLISSFARASTIQDSSQSSGMPTTGAMSAPTGGQLPSMPGGLDGQPPAMPGGTQGGNVTLTGAKTLDGSSSTYAGPAVYDGTQDGNSLTSTASGENVILAQNGAELDVSNVNLYKTGDDENSEETDFYAANAVVVAASGAKITLNNTTIQSDAQGANCVFATGQDDGNKTASTVYLKDVTIDSSKNSSRGLDATFGGIIVASDVNISTKGDHCAGIATDRGGGYISIADSVISTVGGGSPVLYSTGVLEASNLTGTASGSQLVGMEGLNTVRLSDCSLTSISNAQDDVNNGVIIYQSMSGDSSSGTAVFQAVGSTLKTSITGPAGEQVDSALFYVTNTTAQILLSKTTLDYDTKANKLLVVRGNSHNNWGTPGQNGGWVEFSAIDQTLNGDISCDGISSVDMYLLSGSSYTGAIVKSTEYEGDGGVTLSMQYGTTWTVTGNSTLNALYAADGSVIRDTLGKTVSIVGADGTVYVSGNSNISITVGAYSQEDHTASAGTVSENMIDRTAFDSTFAQ